MRWKPFFLSVAIASHALPPVASIGSTSAT